MRRVCCSATTPQTVAEASVTARVVPEPSAWEEGVNMERMNTAAILAATVAVPGFFI